MSVSVSPAYSHIRTFADAAAAPADRQNAKGKGGNFKGKNFKTRTGKNSWKRNDKPQKMPIYVTPASKANIFDLHKSDPEEHSIHNLAAKFQLKEARSVSIYF